MDNLLEYSLTSDPLQSFDRWYEVANKLEQNAQAMALATYDSKHKRPTSRFVLYKGVYDRKIIFYTNYLSPKSQDLDVNPEVALNFYWHNSKKQIRVQGRASKMDRAASEKYFHSRDRESQLVSYISSQSFIIEDKKALSGKLIEAKNKFEGIIIPVPENWGGYLVDAYEFEFFLYGEKRLNDRFLYEKKNGNWDIVRLQP
jgi:pyridoxamine 5'-phosphate oxidase